MRVFCDVTPPTVLITSHINGQFVSNSNITVTCSADDISTGINSGISKIYLAIDTNGGSMMPFSIISTNKIVNYSLSNLLSGSNTVKVYSVDAAGNSSSTNAVTLLQTALWWNDIDSPQALWNSGVWNY